MSEFATPPAPDYIGKYIKAVKLDRPQGRKTDIYTVYTGGDGESTHMLGRVTWWAPWRQYVFDSSDFNSIFNNTCLIDIATFCTKLTAHHRNAIKARKQ